VAAKRRFILIGCMNEIVSAVLRTFGLGARNRGGPSARTGYAAELGAWGEREAERALKSKGYAIIGRNVVTEAGEADLVCRDPDGRTMVVVEVKSRVVREERGLYKPEVAVDGAKRRRLMGVARLLRAANGWHDRGVRVDVVAIERIGGRVAIRHHEGVVRIFRARS
jgi:putative endonuclease